MLPVMPARTCSRVACGFAASTAFALINWPEVQKPHCGRVVIHKGLLQRIELAILHEAFHGGDGAPVHPHRQLAAGIHGLAVDVNRASAAFAAIAAESWCR